MTIQKNNPATMPRRVKNIIGKTYGRLTIVEFLGVKENGKDSVTANWSCICDCGATCERTTFTLNVAIRNGHQSVCRPKCESRKLAKQNKG